MARGRQAGSSGTTRIDAKAVTHEIAKRGIRDRGKSQILEPNEIRERGLVRNAADEFALERGVWDDERSEYLPCRYCEYRAEHIVLTFKNNFRLWEGRFAGQRANPDRLKWAGSALRDLFGWVYFDPRLKQWVRRFRRSAIWIAKKNGKSPIAAGVGLYLLKWDGEPGQNVYSAARDLKQAAIVHRHARVTVANFDTELRDQFSINNTTGDIRYPFTNSTYSTLSGDNFRSQEGKNGSVIIDEIHVVDDRLMQVLDGIDAGRDEPLIFQISTAGNDPTGYGRKEYDYGKRIEAGQPGISRKDVSYFFRCYEAPQDTLDETLMPANDGTVSEETLALIRMANPALGVTIQAKEICEKARRAKRSLTDFVNFKQRRLMIWQKSQNPWLVDQAAWPSCGSKHTVESLIALGAKGGGLGLDLSRTRDLTAAVFIVELDGLFYQIPKFWIPQKRFDELSQMIPMLEWKRDGWLDIIAGEVVRFGEIEDDLCDIIDRIDTILLSYDPKYAADIVERIEVRTNIHLHSFKQTHDGYGKPLEDYERLIYAHELRHDNNPIFNWQVDNVMISESRGNRRPEKDTRYPWKTIDGIQAAIMALFACLESPNTKRQSVYENRGPIVA